MPADLQMELWRALVSSSLLMLMALVAYVVSVLTRMKREQDRRAQDNECRDVQRKEVLENVRRLATGPCAPSDDPGAAPEQRPGAVDHAAKSTPTVVTTDPPAPGRRDPNHLTDVTSGESPPEARNARTSDSYVRPGQPL